MDAQSKVFLITRPRRFGKTLGLSTIQTYFEGKKIMDAGQEYTSHAGKYPVI